MKRDEKLNLLNELSMAVTDKTVFEHELNKSGTDYMGGINTLQANEQTTKNQTAQDTQTEEEIFARLYAQRKK